MVNLSRLPLLNDQSIELFWEYKTELIELFKEYPALSGYRGEFTLAPSYLGIDTILQHPICQVIPTAEIVKNASFPDGSLGKTSSYGKVYLKNEPMDIPTSRKIRAVIDECQRECKRAYQDLSKKSDGEPLPKVELEHALYEEGDYEVVCKLTHGEELVIFMPIQHRGEYYYLLLRDFGEREEEKYRYNFVDQDNPAYISPENLICIFICLSSLITLTHEFLIYYPYSAEFENAVVLYTKEDAVGNLILTRTRKEIEKIKSRNGLRIPNEIIYGFVLQNSKEKEIKGLENNGIDYENDCHKKFLHHGYTANITKKTGDFGCDILAEKNGLKYAIQCKWSSGKVGIKAIQEAYTARKFYKTDFSVLLSNAPLTTAALELASENGVIVINEQQIDILEKLSN